MLIGQIGNNMAALPNVSQILHTEWQEYWSQSDSSVLKNYGLMNTEEQIQLLTQFVRHHIKGKKFLWNYLQPWWLGLCRYPVGNRKVNCYTIHANSLTNSYLC